MSIKRYEFRGLAMLGAMYEAGTDEEASIPNRTPLVLATDYDALAARVAEMEKDAARYRWLRYESEHAAPVNGYMTWVVTGHDHTDACPTFGAELDQAIDAALSGADRGCHEP